MPLSTRYGFADAPTSAIIGDSSLGWTTLIGSVLAGTTTWTVVSSAAFPSGLEFDVVIGVRDTDTGLWTNAENRHVTVVSGTTWTVSAGSLAHADGESISHVITASGLMHNPGALTTAGDMPYLNASGRMDRLGAPADGAYTVTWTSGVPSWTSASGGGLTYADLASPPGGTALGASGTPYTGAYIAGRTYLGPDGGIYDTDYPTLPATVVAYSKNNTSNSNRYNIIDFESHYNPTVNVAERGGFVSFVIFGNASDVNVDVLTSGEFDIQSLSSGLVGLLKGSASVVENYSSTVDLEVGIRAEVYSYDATVTSIRAFDGFIEVDDPGIATTASVFYGRTPSLQNTATLYGLYLENMTGASSNYAVVTAGGAPSVFGGSITATDFIVSGSRFKSDTTNAHTGGLAVYDVDGATYRDFLVWTNANAPAVVMSIPTTGTLSIDASTLTLNSAAVATQTYVGAQGFVTASSSTAFTNKTGAISQWTNDSSYTTLAAVSGVGYLTSVTAHNVLSATHGDTLTASVTRGAIIYGNSTPKWATLTAPGALSGLSHDGTDVSWVTATGTGAPVRATSATLVTPILGVASATSLATSAASPLLLTNGKLVTVALTTQTVNPMTLTIPDFASVSDTFSFVTLAQTLVNKTLTSPTINGGTHTAITGLGIRDTSAAFDVTLAAVSSTTLTAGRTLTLDMGNVAHTLAFGTTAGTITFPTTAAMTVARTDAAQTFTGTQDITTMTGSGGYTTINGIRINSADANNTIWKSAATTLAITCGGGTIVLGQTGSTHILIDTSGNLGIHTDAGLLKFGASGDAIFARDGANILAQRSATTAQKFRVYNTFTTVETAGEWFAVDWATTANVCNLQAVKGSSGGTARVLTLSYGGAQAAPVAAITIPITSGNIVFGGGVQLSNAAVTGLSAGALAATTNASIVLYDSGGQAYRVPCII